MTKSQIILFIDIEEFLRENMKNLLISHLPIVLRKIILYQLYSLYNAIWYNAFLLIIQNGLQLFKFKEESNLLYKWNFFFVYESLWKVLSNIQFMKCPIYEMSMKLFFFLTNSDLNLTYSRFRQLDCKDIRIRKLCFWQELSSFLFKNSTSWQIINCFYGFNESKLTFHKHQLCIKIIKTYFAQNPPLLPGDLLQDGVQNMDCAAFQTIKDSPQTLIFYSFYLYNMMSWAFNVC